MKSTLSLHAAAAAVLFSLGSATYAGPSPQFWIHQHVNSDKTNAAPAMACPKCQDAAITVLASGPAGGKLSPRSVTVGTKHTCDACGGEIRNVQGQTTSEMKSNCPICAKASPSCCKA